MRSPYQFVISATGLPFWKLDKPTQAPVRMGLIYRPTFAASIAIDFSRGDIAHVVATSNIAFNFAAPLLPPGNEGAALRIIISNNSGGALGAITFNAVYKTAAGIAFPANGQSRTYDFVNVFGLAGVGGSFLQVTAAADSANPT